MMQRIPKVGNRRGGLTLLALAVAVAGIIVIVVAIHAQQSAPKVPASAAGTIDAKPSPSPSASESKQAKPEKTPLPPSRPMSISIPAIGVTSEVFPIGKAPDGTLAVPAGARLNKAAWFKNSPTPGQPGPSIIEGHVDSTSGPSIFFKLGNVRPGNKIKVTRKDHTTVTFTVNAVRDFPKTKFPTELVYGGQGNTPTLRLITCSDFDPSIRHHTGNEVVFAHLTAVHHG
jgi:sortase (surface protein transpeptidase)